MIRTPTPEERGHVIYCLIYPCAQYLEWGFAHGGHLKKSHKSSTGCYLQSIIWSHSTFSLTSLPTALGANHTNLLTVLRVCRPLLTHLCFVRALPSRKLPSFLTLLDRLCPPLHIQFSHHLPCSFSHVASCGSLFPRCPAAPWTSVTFRYNLLFTRLGTLSRVSCD